MTTCPRARCGQLVLGCMCGEATLSLQALAEHSLRPPLAGRLTWSRPAPPRPQLLSTKLPADVRRRAEEAIEKRGLRVTVGDVAGAAGLTLQQAEEALKALAADSAATLQVGESELSCFARR